MEHIVRRNSKNNYILWFKRPCFDWLERLIHPSALNIQRSFIQKYLARVLLILSISTFFLRRRIGTSQEARSRRFNTRLRPIIINIRGQKENRPLQQSGISLNLGTGPTGQAQLFNQLDGALVFINKQIKTSPQWSKILKTTDGVEQN